MLALLLSIAALSPVAAEQGWGGAGPNEEDAAWVREHVGMYIWGPNGWQRDVLAGMVRRLGSRIVRSHLWAYCEPWRSDYEPGVQSFEDSLKRSDWRTLIDLHDTIAFTLADGTGRQFEPEYTRAEYKGLATYLLNRYRNTRKTFVLGIWEGDHWLTEGEMASSPASVEKFVRYFQARHQGIEDARAAVPGAQCRVLDMIELVLLDYAGKGHLVNRIVPHTSADLYSLSSWAYQSELIRALDYIKTRAPDSPEFGARNVMLGEAGGIPNWHPPAARVEAVARIISQAREWRVPFITWWELVGGVGEGQCSLCTPPWEGGRYLAPYYWFYRAFHANDDPLFVEDFEPDTPGPAEPNVSEDGRPLNRFGGPRTQDGDVFSCVVGAADSGRCLYLKVGNRGGTWSTDLLHLDAHKLDRISMRLRGTAAATVGVTDRRGRAASVRISPSASCWQSVELPLKTLGGIDRGDLARVTISAESCGELWVDDIAFGRGAARPAGEQSHTTSARVTSAIQAPIISGSQSIPFPGRGSARLKRLQLQTAAALFRPRLSNPGGEVLLADEMLRGQSLEIANGLEAHLRFGPLGPLLDVKRPQAAGLETHDLVGAPEYHSLQPSGDDCWAQWRWRSRLPVRRFRVALYGTQRANTKAAADVLFSDDGRTWTPAVMDSRTWDATGWTARSPESMRPTGELWLRCRVLPDRTLADWNWTASITDLMIELWMDARALKLPVLGGLTFREDSAASGFLGLLDASW